MKYDYRCDSCDYVFEVKQSMKCEPKATCPKCENETKNRIITGGSGFLLQGGGWYSDGYGNKAQRSNS